jgi:hypothetical protein
MAGQVSSICYITSHGTKLNPPADVMAPTTPVVIPQGLTTTLLVYVFRRTDQTYIENRCLVQLLSDQGASDTLRFMETVKSQTMVENLYLIFVRSIGLTSMATTSSSGR